METYMIIRMLFIILSLVCAAGCNSDTTSTSNAKPSINSHQNSTIDITAERWAAIDNALLDFSVAVTERNVALFKALADESGFQLVRIFTSGNLGGRGLPLNQLASAQKVNSDMTFTIEAQTPFNLSAIFPSFPLGSLNNVTRQNLKSPLLNVPYEQWTPFLTQSLKSVPDIETGKVVVLADEASGYWVLADAQIIDNILVGGFAVFSMQQGTIKVTAIIELL
jgi:hypothetical protein